MRLYRFLYLLLLIPICAGAATKGQSAAQVLAKCASKINSAPSLTAKFTLMAGNEKFPCSMLLAKQSYNIDMPQMKVWFDGTTQWTLATQTQQLSITEPTSDELLESNPFAVLNHWDKAYNSRLLKSEQGMTLVELVPKTPSSAPIRRAVVSINPSTTLPAKIVVTLSNGRTFTAAVASITIGKALPASTFIFNKHKHKVAETIDLR